MRYILKTILFCLFGLTLQAQNAVNQNTDGEDYGSSVESGEYNEAEVKRMLEQYMEKPLQFYEDYAVLKVKLDKANQTTLEISEEYLELLDKKDSIINLYKAELSAIQKLYDEVKDNKQTAKQGNTKPVVAIENNAGTVYRVQLSAFNKNEFNKFFRENAKFFGIQDLGDRTVMDIRGFNASDEAYEFSQKMRKLGFNGAFVTKYTDGFRDETYDYLVESGIAGDSYSKKASKMKTKLSGEYPDHVPLGYKEIMENNANTSSEVNESDVEAAAALSTPGIKETTKEETKATPKKKTYTKNRSPESDPSNGQLDAAFDKLFSQ